MKEKKLVVFDMDGTLNRIELFIIPTYKEVLRKFADTEVDDDTVLSLMGCVDEDIYQGLLPGAPMERFEEFMALTVEAEFRNIDLYHGAFDGVPEMIRQLNEEGYILAVCTNGTNGYARKIVQALDIAPYFTWVQGAEPGCTKSETLKMVMDRIQPDKTVMVGDRHHDMQAARDNGLPFVGCQYWRMPHEVEEADIKVSHPSQIIAAVKALIG